MQLDKFKQKYYFIKNIYTLNSFLNITLPIEIETNCDMVKTLLNSNFITIKNADYKIIVEKDNKDSDEYHLDINFNKEIKIIYNNLRSLRYAIKVLNELVDESNCLLPIIHIDDYPSFKVRGIIEGYYGRCYTHLEHLDMLDYMEEKRLNTYMYAPKKDVYHRIKWYELYPEEKIKEFKELLESAHSKGIEIYYTISPGYHEKDEIGFNYAIEDDYLRLYKKLDQLIDCGFRSFGLLLDDIDYNMQGANKEKFVRPGLAHAYICNKIYNYLKEKLGKLNFVMCPTEYHELNDSPYRTDLREKMDKEIKVFWTGDNVCAELISEKGVKQANKTFDHPLLIWENFPVTDFTYGVRQFMAPLENRCERLNLFSEGYLINPMELYETSKIGISCCADYAWNTSRYLSNISFINSLTDVGEEFLEKGIDYINFNIPNVLSYGYINNIESNLLNNKNELKAYYRKVTKSVNALLKLNLNIISEIKPWLKRAKKEEKIANLIMDEKITRDTLLKFLKDNHFNGSTLIDRLIKNTNLLTDEEYETLITKRRGNPWYRVWEHKRFNTPIC